MDPVITRDVTALIVTNAVLAGTVVGLFAVVMVAAIREVLRRDRIPTGPRPLLRIVPGFGGESGRDEVPARRVASRGE